MLAEAEIAWVAREFAGGRMQADIGDELGYSSSAICQQVRKFCDEWSGVNVYGIQAYGDERRRYALLALRRYHGPITKPPMHTSAWYDRNTAAALDEHAWLLRAEGESLMQIGIRLGVSRERAKQRIHKFGVRMAKAMRRTRFKIHHGEAPVRDWLIVRTKESTSV